MPEDIYSGSLFTDLYELTMAQAAWRNDMNKPATFSLFFRGYSPDRSYYAVAGIDDAIAHLEAFQFNSADIEYLESLSIFDKSFLDFLQQLRFTGSVRAMADGTLAFADEPVLEVTAPLIEAQITETALLNSVTTHTTLLTKASRIVQAATGKPVLDMGARRAQGRDGADIAARCASIAGFTATSNVSAGGKHDIPVAGTMAHLFVQSFDNELDAFRAYAAEFPDQTTLLVDTYDTIQGVRNTITVAKEMESRSYRLQAVRLDSGDLAELTRKAREMLDDAGLNYVRIVVSGGLDEYSITELVDSGAPIDSFGVGTRFVVSADAPYANSVYKLVAYAGRPTGKLSSGKQTLPGPKQVFRKLDGDQFAGDIIASEGEDAPSEALRLLDIAIEDGARTRPVATVEETRHRLRDQLAALPEAHRSLKGATEYPVSISEKLQDLAAKTRADAHR